MCRATAVEAWSSLYPDTHAFLCAMKIDYGKLMYVYITEDSYYIIVPNIVFLSKSLKSKCGSQTVVIHRQVKVLVHKLMTVALKKSKLMTAEVSR